MALRDGDDGGDERPTLEWRSRGSRSEHLPPTHLYYCGKLTIRGDSTTGCRRSVAGACIDFVNEVEVQPNGSRAQAPVRSQRQAQDPDRDLFSFRSCPIIRAGRRLIAIIASAKPEDSSSGACAHISFIPGTPSDSLAHTQPCAHLSQMPRGGSPIPEFSLIRQLERSEDLR